MTMSMSGCTQCSNDIELKNTTHLGGVFYQSSVITSKSLGVQFSKKHIVSIFSYWIDFVSLLTILLKF